MRNTEGLIYSILGPADRDIMPLVLSSERMGALLEKGVPIGSVSLTKEIYLDVARALDREPDSLARQVERLCRLCWEKGDRGRLEEIVGCPLPQRPATRWLLAYLGCYARTGKGFYQGTGWRPPVVAEREGAAG